MTRLIDLTLIVVSGKGGVGRTTVTAALARAAADAGKRVLIAASSPADRIGGLYGKPPVGATITAVAPGIDAVNITPEGAIHEYGLLTLRSELVTRALFENRAARAFLDAVPGMDAYALLGKAWWHTTETQAQKGGKRRYDLVLLDGPASGHAPLMLRIPDAIVAAMPKGPLSRDARSIQALLRDPTRSAFVIVTLPEELPAREAIELATAARGELNLPLGPLVVNALPSDEASDPALDPVLQRMRGPADLQNDELAATLRLAAAARTHRQLADLVVADLRRRLGLPLVTLPRLLTADLGPAEVTNLAQRLQTAATSPSS